MIVVEFNNRSAEFWVFYQLRFAYETAINNFTSYKARKNFFFS